MDIYLFNDLDNPNFLFHGSPKKLDVVEQRQAHDSDGNADNEDYAAFLTSSFVMASAYAFKDRIKELSEGLDYNFEIGYDPDSHNVNIVFENVNVDDDMEGFVYVFPFSEQYEHHGRSIQYKSHEDIEPMDVVTVRFGDFKQHYQINNPITR